MNLLISVFPVICGFILDLIFGDPYALPHPVRLIGKLISYFENHFRTNIKNNLKLAGTFTALLVLFFTLLITALIVLISYSVNSWFGAVVEAILIYFLLAGRCLYDESMKVYRAVKNNDITEARRAVSMIVGRDTDKLDEKGIIKAAVETVAENTSDGETAPLFYISLGGALFGFFYKAANTMDSMLGYKNEKYIDFGRFSAKLDDVLNFIPSRISAVLMIISAAILGYDHKSAFSVWKRDRNSQESPNSAQTESAAAGALGIRLLGDAYYFGELHHKNTIGDEKKEIEAEDIKRANKLMFLTSFLMLILACAVRIIIVKILF